MKKLTIEIEIELNDQFSVVQLLSSINFFSWAGILQRAGFKVTQKISNPTSVTFEQIENAVSECYGVTREQLQLKTRKRQIVEARQIAMYLSKEMIKPKPSLKKIGYYFADRDHATVLHASKVIQNFIDTENNFSQKIDEIKDKLK